MKEPDEEAIEEPTTSEDQAEQEATWMVKEWTTIGTVSILLLLILVLGLMQVTGVVDLLAPIVDTEIGQWAVFLGLALIVLVIFIWSRKDV